MVADIAHPIVPRVARIDQISLDRHRVRFIRGGQPRGERRRVLQNLHPQARGCVPRDVAMYHPGAGVVRFEGDDEIAVGGEEGHVPAWGVFEVERDFVPTGIGGGGLVQEGKVVAVEMDWVGEGEELSVWVPPPDVSAGDDEIDPIFCRLVIGDNVQVFAPPVVWGVEVEDAWLSKVQPKRHVIHVPQAPVVFWVVRMAVDWLKTHVKSIVFSNWSGQFIAVPFPVSLLRVSTYSPHSKVAPPPTLTPDAKVCTAHQSNWC